LPKEQPLGIPTVTLPRHKRDTHYASKESISGPIIGQTLRRPEPTYPLPPRSQFALRSSQGSAFTVARKTPQNVDISDLQNYTENLQKEFTGENGKFQAKLRSSTSSLPGGESLYYPRVRDRADV